MTPIVNVIGAGLAGSEAAWQIASRGVNVRLYEMRPVKQTPAHHTDKFAELVCSNSLRANNLTNAVGIIKEEMRMLRLSHYTMQLMLARFLLEGHWRSTVMSSLAMLPTRFETIHLLKLLMKK